MRTVTLQTRLSNQVIQTRRQRRAPKAITNAESSSVKNVVTTTKRNTENTTKDHRLQCPGAARRRGKAVQDIDLQSRQKRLARNRLSAHSLLQNHPLPRADL